jgi:hypothetical protein
MLNNSLAAPVSQSNVAAAAINPDQVLFSVNGKGIALCSSGLPCLWQMRRAMGLN